MCGLLGKMLAFFRPLEHCPNLCVHCTCYVTIQGEVFNINSFCLVPIYFEINLYAINTMSCKL